jgi:hypothetical protein
MTHTFIFADHNIYIVIKRNIGEFTLVIQETGVTTLYLEGLIVSRETQGEDNIIAFATPYKLEFLPEKVQNFLKTFSL